MRKLTKTERALLSAAASAGAAVIFKTIRLINSKKSYIITKAASKADTVETVPDCAAKPTEEKDKNTVDTNENI